MSFVYANPNPKGAHEGDCVIRAISLATGKTWERIYVELAAQGFLMADMPSSNDVWGQYLKGRGFSFHTAIPGRYPLWMFCEDHPIGTYIVGTGSHAVAVINGDYYDTWDSGDESPAFYWKKEM